MNVFDIIGPIMIGPSSSHTAGAAKIGRIARRLLGEAPVEAVIELHGSFAQTYKGHGTDKAIIAGLMGMFPDDERIRESLELAKKAGIKYRFEKIELKDTHPNTTNIIVVGESGKKLTVQGASLGGGKIIINKVNEMDVDFTGDYNTLVIFHKDIPGVVSVVANVLANKNINIASMKVFRSERGGNAIMVIETDQEIINEQEAAIRCLPSVSEVILIRAI